MAARSHGRYEAHPVSGPSTQHNRGLSLLAPGAAGMMIRAYVRRVAEIDIGFFSARTGFDLRVFPPEPFLHQRLVALQRMMQRPLRGNSKLRQKPSNGYWTQRDIEFVLDQ